MSIYWSSSFESICAILTLNWLSNARGRKRIKKIKIKNWLDNFYNKNYKEAVNKNLLSIKNNKEIQKELKMLPTTEDFRNEVYRRISEANGEYIDIKSGDVHRYLGGGNGNDCRCASCCNVMYQIARTMRYEILHTPNKGRGRTLVIRYYK